MLPWNCCRTCLKTSNLNRIFSVPENSEKLTKSINNAIGIQIEPTDNLPQLMCSACVNYINEINKFRKKAHNTETILKKRLENNEVDIKEESLDLKLENDVTITIDMFDENCDDFNDYEENIAVDSIKYVENENYSIEKLELETTEDSLAKKTLESNDTKKVKVKTVKKLRSKKTEEDVVKNRKNRTERAKGEVECEYCHKILTSKLSLRNHHKIHTGFDFVCEHCGKKFITKRLLLMHCRAKHGYEKTDKCSYCDYRASNAEQVKIHERLHTGERPYVCKDCGAGFHRKSSYLQHVAIHLPDKTVQCSQCPARFKSVTLMRIHLSRHRPPAYRYRCGVCGDSFARRRNVARHLTRVHATPPEPRHIQRDKIS